jgi:processive 1,2-diacylglycerol beta-glucosyltransferase
MILLYSQVGELTEDQLDFLIDNLEEEWSEDRDYYVNRSMLTMLKERGADAGLLTLLTAALGDRDEVDILWVDTEEELDDDDEHDHDH